MSLDFNKNLHAPKIVINKKSSLETMPTENKLHARDIEKACEVMNEKSLM